MFNICDKKINIKNINLIHPRKQRIVYNISLASKGLLDNFLVFGSSTRWDCNEYSDVDIAITKDSHIKDKKKFFNILSNETDGSFDFLDLSDDNNLTPLQSKNILEKGVKIYA